MALPLGCVGLFLATVLGIVILAVLGVHWGTQALKSSDFNTQALAQAQADGRLNKLLGSPLEQTLPRSFAFNFGSETTESTAELAIPLSGPKGDGILNAAGQKRDGSWEFSRLEFVTSDSSQTLNFVPVEAPVLPENSSWSQAGLLRPVSPSGKCLVPQHRVVATNIPPCAVRSPSGLSKGLSEKGPVRFRRLDVRSDDGDPRGDEETRPGR